MSAEASLHEMNPTGRFSDRADAYARHRPSYPAAAIDAILDGLGPAPSILAADIGAGTGISARLLGDRGVSVMAVEPNEAMRRAAEPHARVRWVAASAESTTLAAGSVGLVLCAQAFHWFRAAEAADEFARILRPGGRVAVMWNERDDADPLTAEYTRLIRFASGNHPAESRPPDVSALGSHRALGPLRRREFPGAQALDADGLVGRALSASYVPSSGREREDLERGLRAAAARFADATGTIHLRYRVSVYVAERMG